jgi:hypothetical protein
MVGSLPVLGYPCEGWVYPCEGWVSYPCEGWVGYPCQGWVYTLAKGGYGIPLPRVGIPVPLPRVGILAKNPCSIPGTLVKSLQQPAIPFCFDVRGSNFPASVPHYLFLRASLSTFLAADRSKISSVDHHTPTLVFRENEGSNAAAAACAALVASLLLAKTYVTSQSTKTRKFAARRLSRKQQRLDWFLF